MMHHAHEWMVAAAAAMVSAAASLGPLGPLGPNWQPARGPWGPLEAEGRLMGNMGERGRGGVRVGGDKSLGPLPSTPTHTENCYLALRVDKRKPHRAPRASHGAGEGEPPVKLGKPTKT